MSSRGQPIRGDAPSWGLVKGLTVPHHKKSTCYEMLHRASELKRFLWTR